jgi:hypothetical protein
MVGAVAVRRIHSGLRALLACVIFAGMVCSMVSPVFAAGGQTGILQGTVTDTNGQPIANASISAASPTGSYAATASPQGTFTIVGVNVDTYVISVSSPGYDTYVLRGATVTGDQTLTLPLKLSKTTAVIGRVGARSASGAFQPSQTVDSYTISGARVAQTTGSPASTSLNDVVLSAPGVVLTDNGQPTIRGGGQREVGFQLDGVSYTEPFLGQNGSAGLFNGLNSVQVVEGGGDASQGGLSAGVINVIPKRGTYPATGSITAQVGGPNFNNFIGGEYGFATANGSISNYFSMTNGRSAPYLGFHNQDTASYGNYFGESMRNSTQLADNFIFKFGKDHNQSFQVLYENTSILRYGNAGGEPPGTFPTDPFALPYYNFDGLTNPIGAAGLGFVSPTPFAPSTNVAVTQPELFQSVQTRFLKFEYDNSINSSTFFALRYFNWDRMEYDQQEYSLGPFQQGVAVYQAVGGPSVGVSADLTHQFGDKLTVTLNGQYTNQHPIWNGIEPLFTLFGPLPGDFAPVAPGGCPAALGAGTVSCAYGNGVVAAPAFGLNENDSFFQNYGVGLRFQYAISDKLHADFGARYEGQNQHWFNPFNPNNVENPFDVPTAIWGANSITPKVITPRIALSYQIDPNDAVRISYGRAAVFQNSQTTGTPMGIYGNLPALAALPPNLVGATPLLPGAPVANQCGTTLNGLAGLFPCQNYLQQYYWSLDRGLDAPDAGGTQPSVYNNYDASFSHQFSGGFALKVTPFFKSGVDLPSFGLLRTLPGGQQIFSGGSQGLNTTTGAELNLTTADHLYGFSGFLSGTYQNVLQSAPPLSSGEFNGVPQLSAATIALHDLYRAGYIAPASVRIGGTYAFKNGFSITPIIQISSGFPYNVGDTLAATLPDGTNANIPQVNFGPGTPILLGYQNASGTSLNTNYYDPAYSGSQLAPNIAATRGTPTSNNSGGITWYPNVQLNVTLQYKHGKDTIGAQFVNVGSNGFNGTTPAVNPFYQPVGNGTSGPQTGLNTCTAQYGTARGCANLPTNTYAFSNGAYLLTNGNVGTWQLAPLAPMSVNIYYRRQL